MEIDRFILYAAFVVIVCARLWPTGQLIDQTNFADAAYKRYDAPVQTAMLSSIMYQDILNY